jgi:hypothetical protein
MEISFDYWYMFFVMIGVSTVAMTFGIGGAAFLSPFLLIVLDMDPSIALGIGLFVEIFGFTSGVVGFARNDTLSLGAGDGSFSPASFHRRRFIGEIYSRQYFANNFWYRHVGSRRDDEFTRPSTINKEVTIS